MHAEIAKLLQFLKQHPELQPKVYEGNYIPKNTDYHVCPTFPTPGSVNLIGSCSVCGQTVFYATIASGTAKICVACALKKAEHDPNPEFFANADILTNASLNKQRN